MASGNEMWQGAGNFLLGTVRDVARQRVDKEFSAGYHEAAGICVGLLSAGIEELVDRVATGEEISSGEKAQLARLRLLKDEMGRALAAYWSEPETD